MTNLKQRGITSRLSPPLVILVIVISIEIGARLSIIPSTNALVGWLSSAMVSAGPASIFVFSCLEHMVGINVYFPGALVILVGMSVTVDNANLILPTFGAIVLGQLTGYILSFYAGRIFDFRKASTRGARQGGGRAASTVSFFTFAHPHSGALTAFSLGSSGAPFLIFFGSVTRALLFWSPFWAVVSYFGLLRVVDEAGWDLVFFTYLGIWLAYILIDHFLINGWVE